MAPQGTMDALMERVLRYRIPHVASLLLLGVLWYCVPVVNSQLRLGQRAHHDLGWWLLAPLNEALPDAVWVVSAKALEIK